MAMLRDIKISVEYNPINERDIFTSGDYISGKISLELAKDCKAESLTVQLKGKAEVKWAENRGKTLIICHSKLRYFRIQQDIIHAKKGNSVIDQGCHAYPFTLQIPAHDLLPSFKSFYGKIEYTLGAILRRSKKTDIKAKTKFSLVYNGDQNSHPAVMAPQQRAIKEEMKVFASGTVGMDVNISKTGFQQGELQSCK
ncbi:arrestin domain-containing protein 3-like [Cheilinus undulatus]|uniref:arrestin domain-containing protein 3-like n=1 Tax=Cheilinus undulatus TaxID=241271 RepID=UPI001BD63884|nr:arrestin domain-containing protein 3-like [Cheilinus undulatus]